MHTTPGPCNTGHDAAPGYGEHQALTRQLMSSREIAELTGKQHKNVKRDVAAMLAELKIGALNFEHTYLDGQNRKQTEYLLDREHTDCLLTGYSAELRMKVILRWRELEGQLIGRLRIPTSFAEALRLAADQVEQNRKLQFVIDKQAPKVAANRSGAAWACSAIAYRATATPSGRRFSVPRSMATRPGSRRALACSRATSTIRARSAITPVNSWLACRHASFHPPPTCGCCHPEPMTAPRQV